MRVSILAIALSVCAVLGHGDHNQIKKRPEGMSWQSWHMVEEHGIDTYSADSFFTLHDLKNRMQWTREDILNLYGLSRENIVGDGSGMGDHSHGQEVITSESKDHVVNMILSLIDTNKDGVISIDEWRDFIKSGHELPDFGYGQGHHLDFEAEYEQHHWNKYHKNDDPEVTIKHKEDIEHELLHHDHEIEETHNDNLGGRATTNNYLSDVNLKNIPYKYRKQQ